MLRNEKKKLPFRLLPLLLLACCGALLLFALAMMPGERHPAEIENEVGEGGGGRKDVSLQRGSEGDEGKSDQALPHYDMVVAIFLEGYGAKVPLRARREHQAREKRVREIYGRYSGLTDNPGEGKPPLGGVVEAAMDKWGTVGPPKGTKGWTFRVVMVIDSKTAGVGAVGPGGRLEGDHYYVDVRPGFEHINEKTLAMVSLVEHLDFRFLVKADYDTFPCLGRVVQDLARESAADQRRVYAGLLNKCGTVFKEGERLFDKAFVEATGGVLQCHPMYHQGAFYILGTELVQFIYRNRLDLQLMFNEDAMVGLWLLSVRKKLLNMQANFWCLCDREDPPTPPHQQPLNFYHSCKTDAKMGTCIERFGAC